MPTRTQAITVVIAATLAFAAGRSLPVNNAAAAAQPEKKAAPGQPPKTPATPAAPGLDELMQKMQPGEEHKRLDALVGEWEGNVKFWMNPESEPMTSHGTVKRDWVLDGRFIIEHVQGESMGMQFKGLGLLGYNTLEKRYENIWAENMATWISFSTGQYDATKKALTLEGDALDPQTGKRVRQRTVVDLSTPRRHTMLGYCTGPDGKEFKNFEGTFEKKEP